MCRCVFVQALHSKIVVDSQAKMLKGLDRFWFMESDFIMHHAVGLAQRALQEKMLALFPTPAKPRAQMMF